MLQPKPKKNPYTLASERAQAERKNVVSDIGQSLAQSGADMTSRLTKNGAAGFPSALAKEIGSGYSQIVDPVSNYIESADKAMNAQVGKKSDINTDRIMPFLIGSGPAQERQKRKALEANVIADPSANQQVQKNGSIADPSVKVESVGINGVIANGQRQRVAPVKNAYEDAYSAIANSSNPEAEFVRRGNQNILARGADTQRSFNDENYTPVATSNASILDPNAPNTNPQQQLQQIERAKLEQAANMPIDNSLPYDVRKTMVGQRDAAQKSLQLMMESETADKDRASNYSANQNKAILDAQDKERKATEARNKEASYFNRDDVDYMSDGLSNDARLKAAAITKSQGNAFLKMAAGLTPSQRDEALRGNAFDGVFGLDTNSIFKLFRLNEEEAEA